MKRLAIAFAAVSIVVTQAAAAKSDPYFCSPERKEVCNFDKPCQPSATGNFVVVIDESLSSYMRCDDAKKTDTCSTYDMVASGDYKKYRTFEMPGRGTFSKIGPLGDWVEAVSLGSMVIVSHGFCMRDSEFKSGPSK